MLSPILINLERVVVVVLTAVAFLLAILSFRGLVPVSDPLTPLGYVDQLSLLFGLHEQSHVVIVNAQQWAAEVHVFTFQKRLKDGAFYLSGEAVETVGVGLVEQVTPGSVQAKCEEILAACDKTLPFTASRHRTPILLGLPTPAISGLSPQHKNILISGLHLCLENSDLDYSKEASIGLIPPALQDTMQWFAITLLNGKLPYLKPAETPVIVETTEDSLLLTFAAGDVTRLNNSSIKNIKKVAIFGDTWDLITVEIPNLGVLKARQAVLTNGDPGKEWAASPCVNPVVDRWWDFRGHRYHVKGLHKSVEEIKERNGPFAGKRVSRPVANYEACHGVVLNIVQKILGNNFEPVIKELRKRKVYMRGKLFIKCAERGLTDPFKGGNVKLKTFMDSLKHACKVPNTDQPYACVDMMMVGVILDKVLGLHQSSILLTPHQVGGLTGDWPVAAALQIYQSGL